MLYGTTRDVRQEATLWSLGVSLLRFELRGVGPFHLVEVRRSERQPYLMEARADPLYVGFLGADPSELARLAEAWMVRTYWEGVERYLPFYPEAGREELLRECRALADSRPYRVRVVVEDAPVLNGKEVRLR